MSKTTNSLRVSELGFEAGGSHIHDRSSIPTILQHSVLHSCMELAACWAHDNARNTGIA
jgi:hypothetical protein